MCASRPRRIEKLCNDECDPMTTVDVSIPSTTPRSRPLPWRRMAWVTWRQHRVAMGGVIVVLGGLSLYLWATGHSIHHAWSMVSACHPASSSICGRARSDFNTEFVPSAVSAVIMMQLAPALIGAFMGAPILAREFESGTFRFAWTQAMGRRRWALGKLVPLALVLVVMAAACSALFSWYYQPFFSDRFQTPLIPVLLFAFSFGTFAGALLRRVLPAVVVTLGVYAGLAAATALYLRPRYLAPLVTRGLDIPGSAWIIGQWYTKDGKLAFDGVQKSAINAHRLQHFCPSAPQSESLGHCLALHGYTQWTTFQPASRFWPFQMVEGSWLLVVSIFLIGGSLWLIRRRAT